MDGPEGAKSGIQVKALLGGKPALVPINTIKSFDALNVRREQRVDELERQAPGQKTDILLTIGEHDIVDAELSLHGAGLAPCHTGGDQGLELEGNMLGHMTKPRPLLKAPHEAAALMKAAAMLVQSRQGRQEALGKSGQSVGRPFLQGPEIQLDTNHGGEAVEMSPR